MHPELLQQIRPGMKVVDNTSREIGTVERVKFGDDDPWTPEPEAVSISPVESSGEGRTVLEALADVFRGDDLPREVQERLLHQGFVRIDADGLFNADRYVTPDQIAAVTDGRLVLKVSRSELLARP